MSEKLVLVAKSIPEKPGVYQFYNKEDKIIYVGKAKNLKKRVLSYFQAKNHSKKTLHLINSIHNLRHIVVPTESDALILENTLIKEHQPRYNILLRDDKTYPWICLEKKPKPKNSSPPPQNPQPRAHRPEPRAGCIARRCTPKPGSQSPDTKDHIPEPTAYQIYRTQNQEARTQKQIHILRSPRAIKFTSRISTYH